MAKRYVITGKKIDLPTHTDTTQASRAAARREFIDSLCVRKCVYYQGTLHTIDALSNDKKFAWVRPTSTDQPPKEVCVDDLHELGL